MYIKAFGYSLWRNTKYVSAPKGGLKSEDTGDFLHCQDEYSKSLFWVENMNNLFAVLGRKIKFSAQDSDLEYLSWQCKKSPVSSDLRPPLYVFIGTNSINQLKVSLKGLVKVP